MDDICGYDAGRYDIGRNNWCFVGGDPMSEPVRDEVAVQRYGTNVDLSGCPHPYGGYVTYADYAKLEAANREKDAEIERLQSELAFKQDDACQHYESWRKAESELASLRASGGEKPEDAWKRGFIEGIRRASESIEPESISALREVAGAIYDTILRLKPLPYVAPPTLTRETIND